MMKKKTNTALWRSVIAGLTLALMIVFLPVALTGQTHVGQYEGEWGGVAEQISKPVQQRAPETADNLDPTEPEHTHPDLNDPEEEPENTNTPESVPDDFIVEVMYNHLESKPIPQVALTFDDGPCRDTNRLLDILAEKNVKAAFFLIGSSAKNYPDIVRRMYDEGHAVYNHTYNHKDLRLASTETIESQISMVDDWFAEQGFPFPECFRPPYGSYDSRLLPIVNRPVIMWSVDTRDWEVKSVQNIRNNVAKYTKDGSIILMHDVHPTTVDSVSYVIDDLFNRGFEILRLDELLTRDGGELEAKFYSKA